MTINLITLKIILIKNEMNLCFYAFFVGNASVRECVPEWCNADGERS